MTVTEQGPLTANELKNLDAYWRAANYLSVGQIYLLDNPLLREPLRPEHIKPRLLGHWGTTPGLNLIYAHLNRVIRARDLNVIYVTGPGHGGPALVANTYLEGTYSELYPNIAQDETGMRRLFRQFSFPGGIPSHAAPETPGSIHEGGELGYSLAHAYGAAFDNPDLIVVCVVGDGEAETGPLATSWHSNKFLNPAQDGAVLPILHLNGYKIANPTVLARIPDEELDALLDGLRLHASTGSPATTRTQVHQQLAATLDAVARRDRAPSSSAPAQAVTAARPALADDRAAHAQGLDRPEGGRRPAGGGHLAGPPGAARSKSRTNPEHLRQLEEWMRSYRPEELFDDDGTLVAELAALAPTGDRRMSANPHANGGLLLPRPGPARLPRLRRRGRKPGTGASRGAPGCSAAGCAT